MAADNSFDVVSEIDMAEVNNAVQQAMKEITTRYDLKGSHSSIVLKEKDAKLELASQDEYKLKAVTEILHQKLVKRGVSIRALEAGKIEPASGGSVRQVVSLQNGLTSEKAREIVRIIKDAKQKVQTAIQGDAVRVSGKDRDTLQATIALLRSHDFGVDLQFINYRSQ